jgi:hypothetical protein
MHRSGTSALAGALEALGFEAGPSDDLMPGDEGNPEGYFELKSIASLDDEMLAQYEGRWDSPPVLAPGWERDDAAQAFAQRARLALGDLYSGDHYVLKDPRISLLLPLWRQVVGDGACAVVIVRDPLEVAGSLTHRNALPTFTGLALWAAYNRALLRDLEGMKVHVCSYADLVNNPATVIGDVLESLRAWGVVNGDVDSSSAIAMIRPELRRNSVANDTDVAQRQPGETTALLELILDRRGRHDRFEVGASLEPAWWEAALLDERRVVLQWALTTINAVQTHSDNLQVENAVLWERLENTNQVLDNTTAELAALRRRVDHVTRMIPGPLYRAVTKRSHRG